MQLHYCPALTHRHIQCFNSLSTESVLHVRCSSISCTCKCLQLSILCKQSHDNNVHRIISRQQMDCGVTDIWTGYADDFIVDFHCMWCNGSLMALPHRTYQLSWCRWYSHPWCPAFVQHGKIVQIRCFSYHIVHLATTDSINTNKTSIHF